MRIVTWNVNSLKVRLPRVLELLAELAPDAVCVQETKVERAAFPHAELREAATRPSTTAAGGGPAWRAPSTSRPRTATVYDPAAFVGSTHVTPEKRAARQALLELGLRDAYREVAPDGDRYTWWAARATSTRTSACASTTCCSRQT